MAKAVTTLTDVKTRSGTSARGPWTLSIFSAADGREYSTLEGSLASKANSLLNTPVELEYGPGNDPVKYPNSFKLNDVQAAASGAVVTTTDSISGQPVQHLAGLASSSSPQKNDQFRTKEQIMRTDAYNATLTLFGIIGLDPLSGVEEFEGWLGTAYKYIETGVFETPRVSVEA
jgi:hypothetical protein